MCTHDSERVYRACVHCSVMSVTYIRTYVIVQCKATLQSHSAYDTVVCLLNKYVFSGSLNAENVSSASRNCDSSSSIRGSATEVLLSPKHVSGP